MSYFQRHQRNNDSTDRAYPVKPLQPYPLRSKKNLPSRIKTQNSFQDNNRSKRKNEPTTKPHPEPSLRNNQEQKAPGKAPARFATQGPISSQSAQQPIKAIFKEADNSMEEMLNSSMSHFEHFLRSRDQISQENSQLVEQNQQLREAVEQLMGILRSKLDSALRKQQQEMKGVMSDYLQLITKLLADKDQLTSSLETAEKTINQTKKEIKNLETQIRGYQERQAKSSQGHLRSINITQELLPEVSLDESSLQEKISSQNAKIKTLYEFLQRSQKQKKNLQEALHRALNEDRKYKCLEEEFQFRIQQMERQHQEEFIQYERAMREALAKKDETISRLSRMLEGRPASGITVQDGLSYSNLH